MSQKIVMVLEFDAPDDLDPTRLEEVVTYNLKAWYLERSHVYVPLEDNAPIDLSITHEGVEEV